MRNIFAACITPKGGVGKTFAMQVVRETLKGPDGLNNVRVIDSDVANSSMKQIDPTAQFAGLRDANDIEARGVIAKALVDLGDGVIDAAVWDTAAGAEDIMYDSMLPLIVSRARKTKTSFVCFRLITTSQYTQDSAIEFAEWAKANGVAIVFVRNLGQGRAAKYFNEWHDLPERVACMPPVVEVILPDLGCWIADEASSLGLGLGDIATGDFSRLTGRALEVAQRKFNPEVQLAVADYIELRRVEFENAITQAIANIKAHGK